MARWNRPTNWKRKRIALLLRRDGQNCWLCARPISIPPRRPAKRASIEHLTPRALGGGDGLDNLVVCHAACNRHLRDHPREKKLAIRTKWHREAARVKARLTEVPPDRTFSG